MSNTSKQFTFDLNSLEKITPLVTAGLNFINEVGSLLGSESEAEDAPKPAFSEPRVYENFEEVPVGVIVSDFDGLYQIIRVDGLFYPLFRHVSNGIASSQQFNIAIGDGFHRGPYREVLN